MVSSDTCSASLSSVASTLPSRRRVSRMCCRRSAVNISLRLSARSYAICIDFACFCVYYRDVAYYRKPAADVKHGLSVTNRICVAPHMRLFANNTERSASEQSENKNENNERPWH